MERELVKIKSDNPAHPHGYYTQFKDRMKPEDVLYSEIPEPARVETLKPINRKKVTK
jgi:hypothetical protein